MVLFYVDNGKNQIIGGTKMNEIITDVVEEEVIVEEEITEEEVSDEIPEEEEITEEVEEESKSVPLDTFLSTKKRAKEAEKRIKELEDKFYSKEKNEKITNIRNKFKEQGYDDAFIDLQIEMYEDTLSAMSPGKKDEDALLIEEIKDLAEYHGKKDALRYKEQIIAKVKNNGLTVEEAYTLSCRNAPKVYETEVRTQVEQLNAAKRRKAPDKVLNSSGSSTQSVSLNNEDRKMLATMQKLQPDRNWTAAKLKKFNKMYD